jgi:hypothetical protein
MPELEESNPRKYMTAKATSPGISDPLQHSAKGTINGLVLGLGLLGHNTDRLPPEKLALLHKKLSQWTEEVFSVNKTLGLLRD